MLFACANVNQGQQLCHNYTKKNVQLTFELVELSWKTLMLQTIAGYDTTSIIKL